MQRFAQMRCASQWATLHLQDSGLWPWTSKGLSLEVKPFSHCHCLICVKWCWCILNSTLKISGLLVSADPGWCKGWCARIQGVFSQLWWVGCLGLYWKGDEGGFCFIHYLKTQAWNIHHKEKNQARSCKKKKISLGSGQVFGYLFLIKHSSGFVFFSVGSYNCGISNPLKTVKKKKKRIP